MKLNNKITCILMGDAHGKNDNEIASRPPFNGKFLVVMFGFTIVLLKPTMVFLIVFLWTFSNHRG